MTNPDIPPQPQPDPETEARTRRVNRLLGYSSGLPMPRRIIDGRYTSHIEGYPEYAPTQIEASEDAPVMTYTSNEDGYTFAYTDPQNPDANWSDHFPRTHKTESGNNQ